MRPSGEKYSEVFQEVLHNGCSCKQLGLQATYLAFMAAPSLSSCLSVMLCLLLLFRNLLYRCFSFYIFKLSLSFDTFFNMLSALNGLESLPVRFWLTDLMSETHLVDTLTI